jgi:15-cis-phytoene synthase
MITNYGCITSRLRIVNDLLQHGNCAARVTGGAQPRRDVDEDLERGRIYLPADELAAYDVDRDVLMWCHTNRRTDARVRRALIEQHAETRRIYGYAHHGISLLQPRSRPCVSAALILYSEILDRIEASDFDIFSQRATVGTGRRLRVAAAGLCKAWAARLRDNGA